jgi:flagellar basal-body rod protein FlgF
MIKGLYTSAAGMLPLDYRQDLVANNLANVNTSGYKQDRAFVHELINADLYLNENGIASTGLPPRLVNVMPAAYRAAVGDASQVIVHRTDFTRGKMEVTGNDLNLAIDGDGFFAIDTPQGEQYTRSGYFSVNADGELVTAEGYTVLGDAGPINVQGGKIIVQNNGNVMVNNEPRGTLRITDFSKPYRMTKTADNLFIAEAGSAEQEAEDFVIRQGVLEQANTHPIDQMVKMIEILRLFELNQRAIRLQDETLQQAVTQTGRV